MTYKRTVSSIIFNLMRVSQVLTPPKMFQKRHSERAVSNLDTSDLHFQTVTAHRAQSSRWLITMLKLMYTFFIDLLAYRG